jgi:hypothetical protein
MAKGNKIIFKESNNGEYPKYLKKLFNRDAKYRAIVAGTPIYIYPNKKDNGDNTSSFTGSV